jgi:hypothetical protein
VLRIRIRNRNRIRKDPKLLAGSGSEINISDPDSNPDPKPDSKEICKKESYFRPKKGNFRQLWNISTFSRNNLIRISIFATQFTSNSLTDNRIIGIHCPVTFCADVNFVTRLRSTAARWLVSRTHDSKKQCCGSGMFIPDPRSDFFPSRIRSVSIPDPHFNPKTTKKWFLSSRKYDPGCSTRIPDPDADFLSTHPGQKGVKKAPDPGSEPATLQKSPVKILAV